MIPFLFLVVASLLAATLIGCAAGAWLTPSPAADPTPTPELWCLKNSFVIVPPGTTLYDDAGRRAPLMTVQENTTLLFIHYDPPFEVPTYLAIIDPSGDMVFVSKKDVPAQCQPD